jgi:hypothetical protein
MESEAQRFDARRCRILMQLIAGVLSALIQLNFNLICPESTVIVVMAFSSHRILWTQKLWFGNARKIKTTGSRPDNSMSVWPTWKGSFGQNGQESLKLVQITLGWWSDSISLFLKKIGT